MVKTFPLGPWYHANPVQLGGVLFFLLARGLPAQAGTKPFGIMEFLALVRRNLKPRVP